MARYQHLPVYQSTYVLVREVYKLKTKLPKTVKYELGSELSKSCLKVLKGIVLANGQSGSLRIKVLRIIILEIDVVWTYFRLLYDLKVISQGEFKVFSEKLAAIGPQVNSWLKWAIKNK